ncbi:MAG: hypothetical protein FWD09_00675 [Lentimicrobiaceae bacterium]|nr:hypothetical protein [Lentimicrobiaceae bacterium]
MNNIRHYLFYSILALIFFTLISCDALGIRHCRNMPKQIEGGTGEIISNAMIRHPAFIASKGSSNEGVIITSDSLNGSNLVVSFDNGITYNPIDFSQYTLLGKYAEGQSMAFFDRNVTKDAKKKKYIYTIRVIFCGDFLDTRASMNWVLVPKIEDDFSVEFVIEHKEWTRK